MNRSRGVDAVSARLIRTLLQGYTERGATVIFSSHVMELVERLCSRIGIMVDGELIIEGPRQELLDHYSASSVEDAFLTAVGAEETPGGLDWLDASSG